MTRIVSNHDDDDDVREKIEVKMTIDNDVGDEYDGL